MENLPEFPQAPLTMLCNVRHLSIRCPLHAHAAQLLRLHKMPPGAFDMACNVYATNQTLYGSFIYPNVPFFFKAEGPVALWVRRSL